MHKANWHRFIEFNFSDQHAICLNSRNREFEGSVAQTRAGNETSRARLGSARRGSVIQRVEPGSAR